jgi:hypothetical protein
MKQGDTILFRGRRRFVMLVTTSGVALERLIGKGAVSFYSVGIPEKRQIRIVRRATKRDVTRARQKLSKACPPWTSIKWSKDGQPSYIVDLKHPTFRRKRW